MIGQAYTFALQQAQAYSKKTSKPAFLYETITGGYDGLGYRLLMNDIPIACVYVKGDIVRKLETGEDIPSEVVK